MWRFSRGRGYSVAGRRHVVHPSQSGSSWIAGCRGDADTSVSLRKSSVYGLYAFCRPDPGRQKQSAVAHGHDICIRLGWDSAAPVGGAARRL